MKHEYYTNAPIDNPVAALHRIEAEIAAWQRGHNSAGNISHLRERAALLRQRIKDGTAK